MLTKKATAKGKAKATAKSTGIAAAVAAKAMGTSLPVPGAPIIYKGAKVAASDSKHGWRIWLEPAKVAKESFVPYGDSKAKSFRAACKLISDSR